jgi:hypothetical protein
MQCFYTALIMTLCIAHFPAFQGFRRLNGETGGTGYAEEDGSDEDQGLAKPERPF